MVDLNGKARRALMARSHALKPAIVTDADAIDAGVVAHVRELLTHRDLIKVRIRAASGAECDAAAEQLAAQSDCALVRRTGRVALLYRADAAAPDDAAGA